MRFLPDFVLPRRKQATSIRNARTTTEHRIAGEDQSPINFRNTSDLQEDQSPVKDKFTFLKELTASKHHHGKTSFYQHLFNVYSYLKSQSLPGEVCDAGLFHSIYGTEFFNFQSAVITRDLVRSYIGEYAEELAYIFCSLKQDRFGSIVNNRPGWAPRQHLDLCYIEHANFWDGRNFRNFEKQMNILSLTIARLREEAGLK